MVSTISSTTSLVSSGSSTLTTLSPISISLFPMAMTYRCPLDSFVSFRTLSKFCLSLTVLPVTKMITFAAPGRPPDLISNVSFASSKAFVVSAVLPRDGEISSTAFFSNGLVLYLSRLKTVLGVSLYSTNATRVFFSPIVYLSMVRFTKPLISTKPARPIFSLPSTTKTMSSGETFCAARNKEII